MKNTMRATGYLWLAVYYEADAKQKPLLSEEQSFAITTSTPPDQQQEAELVFVKVERREIKREVREKCESGL